MLDRIQKRKSKMFNVGNTQSQTLWTPVPRARTHESSTRPPGVSTALSGECRFPGRHTFPRRSQKPPAPRPAISGIVLPVSPRDLRHETNLGCGLEAFQRLTKQQKGEQIAYTHNSCERSG